MSFGKLLARAIQDVGISQREFARRVKYPVQSLNQVIKNKRRPPRKHIGTWAHALASVIDPKYFAQMALLEHCPPEIKDLVTSLWAKRE